MWGKILFLTLLASFVAACANEDSNSVSQLSKSDIESNESIVGQQALNDDDERDNLIQQYSSKSASSTSNSSDSAASAPQSSLNKPGAVPESSSESLTVTPETNGAGSFAEASSSDAGSNTNEVSVAPDAPLVPVDSFESASLTATLPYNPGTGFSSPSAGVLAAVNIAVALITDNRAPEITLLGSSTLDVLQGSVYNDAGATVSDDYDSSLTINTSGEVNTFVLGEYAINYSATDSEGYTTTATRTVNVIAAPATLARAHRLLLQATFGPTQADLYRVQQIGTTAWIDEQLNKPSAYDSDTDAHKTHLERMIAIAKHAQPTFNWDDNGTTPFNQTEASFRTDEYQMAAWWENAIGLHPTNTTHGRDQLRQRVAYALSQLLVTSVVERPLYRRGEGLAAYYDILARNALGNYRTLLGEVARSPTMGVFLSHQGNSKTNIMTGTRPDENFAREVMQLFTIGLYDLNNDGTPDRDGNPLTLDDTGTNLVPSYSQGDIEELAKVMTGWDLVGNANYGHINNKTGDYTIPMEFTASEHELGSVTVMGQSIDLSSGTDGSGMDAALDVLFNHPNIGPFVSKHLIMRLVSSNPSPAYINRVATVFNNDGNGVRGNLKAVIRAILVDYEARRDGNVDSFGKIKEPLLAWTQLLRGMDAVPLDGWTGLESTLVNGVYWFKHPERYLGQGPLRSPSVFNFYSPDFVPSDSAFANNDLVAPEMQIEIDQFFLQYNNKIRELLTSYEKNKITVNDGKTLSDFAASKSYGSDQAMLISFDKELVVFLQALNGDYDNIENNDTAGVPFREKAVDSLITHLDQLLLGETMSAEYKAALRTYLLNADGLRYPNNVKESLFIVREAVRMIVTSGLYMVQK